MKLCLTPNQLQKSYYEILEVPTHSTLTQIRNAYLKKSIQFHPDKVIYNNNFSLSQTEKEQIKNYWILIAQAYKVLKDEESRKMYDSFLAIRSKLLEKDPSGNMIRSLEQEFASSNISEDPDQAHYSFSNSEFAYVETLPETEISHQNHNTGITNNQFETSVTTSLPNKIFETTHGTKNPDEALKNCLKDPKIRGLFITSKGLNLASNSMNKMYSSVKYQHVDLKSSIKNFGNFSLGALITTTGVAVCGVDATVQIGKRAVKRLNERRLQRKGGQSESVEKSQDYETIIIDYV